MYPTSWTPDRSSDCGSRVTVGFVTSTFSKLYDLVLPNDNWLANEAFYYIVIATRSHCDFLWLNFCGITSWRMDYSGLHCCWIKSCTMDRNCESRFKGLPTQLVQIWIAPRLLLVVPDSLCCDSATLLQDSTLAMKYTSVIIIMIMPAL